MLSKSWIQVFLLSIVMTLGLLILPNPVKGQSPNFDQVYSKVLEVQGNTVRLSGGITVDISEAKFSNSFGSIERPTINVGNSLSLGGLSIVSSGANMIVKATRASVFTGKEFFYLGVAQDTDSKTVTIYNKDVEVNSTTSLINQRGKSVKLKAIKPGSPIELYGGVVGDKIVAQQVIKSNEGSPKGQLIAFIKSIDGTKIELEGGFLVDVSKILRQVSDPDDFFQNPKIFNAGTEIIVGLTDQTAVAVPSGIVPIDGAFGLARSPITIDAKLQAVNLTEKTITVLNRTIAIPEDVIIEARGKRVGLEGLLIGSSINIRADLNDNQIVPKLITSFNTVTFGR